MSRDVRLVVRFRRASGEERQQLRWVASAAVVAAVGIPVAMAGILIESPTVVGLAVLGSAVVLCLAIAAAILRDRLYDLDHVISRTLTYGLLTLSLGLGYAGVVLGLGRLLGQDSAWPWPAAFQPARRLQRPPAPPGRHGHPARRAASRGRPDHAARPDVDLAAANEIAGAAGWT